MAPYLTLIRGQPHLTVHQAPAVPVGKSCFLEFSTDPRPGVTPDFHILNSS
jgi:hypothetical protein